MAVRDEIRQWWDEDAPTYDRSPNHRAGTPAEEAAWTATLSRLLPAAPARVLDCGTGTGFLSLIAARLGHDVTAVDLSGRMLDVLRASAAREGLAVRAVQGPAEEVPDGRYDAVMERHLIWTLPEPEAALATWRNAVEPGGRMLSVAHLPEAGWRRRARRWLHRWEQRPPEHHGSYPETITRALPLTAAGMEPSQVAALLTAAGWRAPRLERLTEVEWARRLGLPPVERALGVPAYFAVVADAPSG